jgi:putative DNA primase/helicase
MTLETVLDKLGARRNGKEWIAKCPAHDDSTPSLGITEGDNGGVLLCCHAGCSTESVCAAMGIKLSDLFPEKKPQTVFEKGKPQIVAEYEYTDEEGKLLYQVVRYKEPKDFKQRRRDEKGAWIWNVNGVHKVLYNLRGVLASNDVLVVEGEKDVEAATHLAFVATCNTGGAGKWSDEYSECLRGKNVTIIADADEKGRKHAQQVATSLYLRAASIKVLELPGAKDLSEWQEQGGARETLQSIISGALPWKPADTTEEKKSVQLGSFSTAELFTVQSVKIEWLAWPFAAIGLSSILDALPKLGKTRFFLEAVKASRDARPFLNYATKPMRVIYVSEQSAASLAMQAREVGFTGDEPVEELRWITREHWSRYIYTEFLERLETDFVRGSGYNTLIIDTWHTVARLEDEKDASEVNRLGNLTIDLATRNHLALAFGRHDRKSGGDIGVSGRSSIQLSGLVDVILHLVRVPNQASQRKLELLGRVPGLPNDQVIELIGGSYQNWGEPQAAAVDRAEQVKDWLDDEPGLTGEQIVDKFAALVPPVEISVATARRYRAEAQKRAHKK